MNKFKRLLTIIISAILVAGVLSGCASSNTSSKKTSTSSIEEIKKRGVLRVGVFVDKAPFSYVDSNGVNQGYDVYLARRFAKDLMGDESKIQFVPVDAASRVSYLQSKKVDIIMANFTVTEDRKKVVDFANPYMKVSLGVVSPDNAVITSVDQLKGKKVIVAKGTTAETYFTKSLPDIQLVKYDQYSEIFQALKDKRGDVIANDNTELLAWAKANPGYTVGITKLGSQDTIAPAVTKGNTELLNWINNELTALGKENFVHKDYEATLKSVYGEGSINDIVVEGGKL